MNLKTALKKLDELFSSPTKWTQHTFARDKFGFSIEETNPQAKCFCLTGGLERISEGDGVLGLDMRSALIDWLPSPHYNLVEFNDNDETKFRDIKKLIEKARNAL